MKKFIGLFMIAILGGIISLGGYVLLFEDDPVFLEETPVIPSYTPVNFNSAPPGMDFTEAANKSIHAVVHVKNVAVTRSPFFNSQPGYALQGTGSGVIISPDGYIVTNNHVIQNASSIQVTLNNNKDFIAEVVGTDPISDIALLKIDPEKELPYLPFGNSNNVQIGEWVLAVGNPFNLTSTVTAGIVSAKARDLGMDSNVSSFIQTDAAINPGNSGGALVNTRGELIGINTAISSRTGSYIGYAFAVPSNNARKIVEDLLEYGDVQKGVLGIRGVPAARLPREMDIDITQGVYVGEVDPGSGAEKAGIEPGDIINQIDNIEIRKFSDLTGYINSKRPNDVVRVKVIRDGEEKIFDVKLSKYEVYQIRPIGLEVANATPEFLRDRGLEYGVQITRGLGPQMQNQNLEGIAIVAIDEVPVENVRDVEEIMTRRDPSKPLVVTFVDPSGEVQNYVWR